MSTVKLPVTNGPCTLVDDDIAQKLKGKKLFLTGRGRYVGISINRKPFMLHRYILGAPRGFLVDHKNGDIYNNTKENLRTCTHSENSSNIRKFSTCISGYRCVHKKTGYDRYTVRLQSNKKLIYFFTLRSRHIAGIFADQILVNRIGPFVLKNFSKKITRSNLKEFLEDTSGRIFRVVFSRRSDGRQREMTCRTGVHSHLTGGTIPFDPISMGLFSVYDVQKKAYRFIPLENVICIRYAKTNYRVVA